jgi:hypothetical protein
MFDVNRVRAFAVPVTFAEAENTLGVQKLFENHAFP